MLPAQTHTAVAEFVRAHSEGGVVGTFPYEARVAEYRRTVGRLIGAGEDEIAFLRSTSEGANVIAHGVRWRNGDEVIVGDDEFGANVHPWLRLRELGIRVRLIPTAGEPLTPAVLRRFISPRTRLVAVSWVGFAEGYRRDLRGLAAVAHNAGALFCVDAIQGLGALALDAREASIDALYCGGQKWLLALQGVSFLYIRRELLSELGLGMPGWRSVRDMWDFLRYEQEWATGASRFEGGTPNFAGAVALATSAALLLSAGIPNIERHVLELVARFSAGLRDLGAELLSDGPHRSGIVTFRLGAHDPLELGRALQARGIITTYRRNGIRVSPHGYNTTEEIDALLDALASP